MGWCAVNLGDRGPMHYKRSRRGEAEIDSAVQYVLEQDGPANSILDFSPYGYDERQYCSPGIDLPVGCLIAHAARAVPGVPHLGRQPRLRPP